MDTLSQDALKDLLGNQRGPCVSLFMPTHRRARAELLQDPMLFKQLLDSAEQQLVARGYKDEQIEALLKPARVMSGDQQLWSHPKEGLAVLCSAEACLTYQLPSAFAERAMVSEEFYLKPLLPFFSSQDRFFILALSQNAITLLEGDRFGIRIIPLPESVPGSLAESLQYKEGKENLLESHSSSSDALMSRGGHRAAIFHGHGTGTDEAKDQLLRYFRQVNKGLHELLHNETIPLILAGVAYLLPIYRDANTYPHLLTHAIEGNPDRLSPEALRDSAWEIMQSQQAKTQQEILRSFREPADIHLISQNITDIVPAAYNGRIDTLFVAIDREQWGKFEPTKLSITIHEQEEPDDKDLLDVAATQTLLHGGKVYAIEYAQMPDQAFAAALFRY
ncbi:MAG TPA: hypothetical protein VGN34_33155 [Ktedonobacteraceae bacterium]|jgi:hypothetical protein